MFKKLREINRRRREFQDLAGDISLAELDERSKSFNRETGISTGEMMEVGIHYLKQLDQIDQTSMPAIRDAMRRTLKAAHSGELKMLDGKTPINRVADADDLYTIMGFVSGFRPTVAETIRTHA